MKKMRISLALLLVVVITLVLVAAIPSLAKDEVTSEELKESIAQDIAKYNEKKEAFLLLKSAFDTANEALVEANAAFLVLNEPYEELLAQYEVLRIIYEETKADYLSGDAAYSDVTTARTAAVTALNAAEAARTPAMEAWDKVESALEAAEDARKAANDALTELAEFLNGIISDVADYNAMVTEENETAKAENAEVWEEYLKAAAKYVAEYIQETTRLTLEHLEQMKQYNADMEAYRAALAAYEAAYTQWLKGWNEYSAAMDKIALGADSPNIRYGSRDGATVPNFSEFAPPPGHWNGFLTSNTYNVDVGNGVTISNLQGGNNGAEVTVTKPGIYTVYVHCNKGSEQNGNFEAITFLVPEGTQYPAVYSFGNYDIGGNGGLEQIAKGAEFIPLPGKEPAPPIQPVKPELIIPPFECIPVPECIKLKDLIEEVPSLPLLGLVSQVGSLKAPIGLSALPTEPGTDPTGDKPTPGGDEDDPIRIISTPPVVTTTTPPTVTASETPPPPVVVSTPPDEGDQELFNIDEEGPPLDEGPSIKVPDVPDDPKEEQFVELEDDIVPLGELPETGRSSFYLFALGLGALVAVFGIVLLVVTKNRKNWNI